MEELVRERVLIEREVGEVPGELDEAGVCGALTSALGLAEDSLERGEVADVDVDPVVAAEAAVGERGGEAVCELGRVGALRAGCDVAGLSSA